MSANLQKLKEEMEPFYKSVGSVSCPYFKEEVSFNSKGWKHLRFKTQRESRAHQDQYIRMKNLRFAPIILKKSSTLQEVRIQKQLVEVKTRNRKEKVRKSVTYYGFMAILQDGDLQRRFKIIVKQIEGGEKHFWSIIPFWKNNKELKLHSGNPEED